MTKQGRADIRGPLDQKVEPRAYEKSPGGVSRIGAQVGSHVTERGEAQTNYQPIDLGNGYNATGPNGPMSGWDGSGPGAGRKVRNSGSQGKY